MNLGILGCEAAAAGRGRWDVVSVRPVWDWRAGVEMASQAGGSLYCVRTPGTPLMAIQRKGAKIEIGWEGGEEFVLELAKGGNTTEAWKPVAQRPRRWANLNLVVIESGCGDHYFRLRRSGG